MLVNPLFRVTHSCRTGDDSINVLLRTRDYTLITIKLSNVPGVVRKPHAPLLGSREERYERDAFAPRNPR